MYSFNLKSLSLLAMLQLPAVLAVPKVKSVPISGGCAAYPDYDASTGTAGPWVIQIVQTGGSPIEGFWDTANDVSYPNGTVKYGYINFPSNNNIAKTPIRCTPSSLPSLETLTSSGWTKLQISPQDRNATMIYPGPGTTINGSPLLPFNLYRNGKQLDGVYLGGYASNATTWAVKYYPKGTGSYGQDFYYIRLLGPKSGKVAKDEFTAFIKVFPNPN